MAHYFTDNRDLKSNPKDFKFYFENEIFNFTTDNGVFCKSEVDYGSYLLIKTVYKLALGKTLLDLGSGYGPIGIVIKRFNPQIEVDAVEVNPRAVELNILNANNNSTPIDVYLSEDILTLNKIAKCGLDKLDKNIDDFNTLSSKIKLKFILPPVINNLTNIQ